MKKKITKVEKELESLFQEKNRLSKSKVLLYELKSNESEKAVAGHRTICNLEHEMMKIVLGLFILLVSFNTNIISQYWMMDIMVIMSVSRFYYNFRELSKKYKKSYKLSDYSNYQLCEIFDKSF